MIGKSKMYNKEDVDNMKVITKDDTLQLYTDFGSKQHIVPIVDNLYEEEVLTGKMNTKFVTNGLGNYYAYDGEQYWKLFKNHYKSYHYKPHGNLRDDDTEGG